MLADAEAFARSFSFGRHKFMDIILSLSTHWRAVLRQLLVYKRIARDRQHGQKSNSCWAAVDWWSLIIQDQKASFLDKAYASAMVRHQWNMEKWEKVVSLLPRCIASGVKFARRNIWFCVILSGILHGDTRLWNISGSGTKQSTWTCHAAKPTMRDCVRRRS
jgi:hypothetical protein